MMEECCICFETYVQFAVLTCGHRVCGACARAIARCPLCRQPFAHADVTWLHATDHIVDNIIRLCRSGDPSAEQYIAAAFRGIERHDEWRFRTIANGLMRNCPRLARALVGAYRDRRFETSMYLADSFSDMAFEYSPVRELWPQMYRRVLAVATGAGLHVPACILSRATLTQHGRSIGIVFGNISTAHTSVTSTDGRTMSMMQYYIYDKCVTVHDDGFIDVELGALAYECAFDHALATAAREITLACELAILAAKLHRGLEMGARDLRSDDCLDRKYILVCADAFKSLSAESLARNIHGRLSCWNTSRAQLRSQISSLFPLTRGSGVIFKRAITHMLRTYSDVKYDADMRTFARTSV